MPVRQVAIEGFSALPSVAAVDPVLGLLAVGCAGGRVKVYGKEGVERVLQLPSRKDVKFLQFDVNEVRPPRAPARSRTASMPLQTSATGAPELVGRNACRAA